MQCLASVTTNLRAWVRIPAWAVSLHPTQLFLLPWGMVGKWGPGGDMGKINCGNTDVTSVLCQVKSYLKPQTQTANATEMKTEATRSYRVCPQLYLKLYFIEKELNFWPMHTHTQTMVHDGARDCHTGCCVSHCLRCVSHCLLVMQQNILCITTYLNRFGYLILQYDTKVHLI